MFAYEILQVYSKSGTRACLSALIVDLCALLDLEKSSVCWSLTSEFSDELLYVAGQLLLKPDQFCGFLLPNTCGGAYDPLHNTWNVTFPNIPKPPLSPVVFPPADAPTLRIVQLTDIHFDLDYQFGSDPFCKDPLCCRNSDSLKTTSRHVAGYWGSPIGKCDIPLRTLETLFKHLNTSESFDYILWTGDVPPHNIWNQTRQSQLEYYEILVRLFLDYFPGKAIYSAVGNHESYPVDSFPPNQFDIPKKYSVSWLYEALSIYWDSWIDVSQTSSIKKIASYVVKPRPGLRLISLNTIYCYGTNFWVYLNQTDPDGVLNWLIGQLQDAETIGDKVHILGHIPLTECMSQWSLNYYRIINRYEDTIMGQFFGHTHNDHFGVFYEDLDVRKRPTNVYYVAPSITTYPNRYPLYRIYTVDSYVPAGHRIPSFRVLNHETYIFDLDRANRENITEWKLSYNAKIDYNLTTLLPDDWSRLIISFKDNPSLFKTYQKHYWSKEKECDFRCRRTLLCELRNLVKNYPKLCDDFELIDKVENQYSWFYDVFLSNFFNSSNNVRFPIPKECKFYNFNTLIRRNGHELLSFMDLTSLKLPSLGSFYHYFFYVILPCILSIVFVVLLFTLSVGRVPKLYAKFVTN